MLWISKCSLRQEVLLISEEIRVDIAGKEFSLAAITTVSVSALVAVFFFLAFEVIPEIAVKHHTYCCYYCCASIFIFLLFSYADSAIAATEARISSQEEFFLERERLRFQHESYLSTMATSSKA